MQKMTAVSAGTRNEHSTICMLNYVTALTTYEENRPRPFIFDMYFILSHMFKPLT